MRRVGRLLVLLILALFIGGDGAARAADDTDVYEGVYVLGFEASEFYANLRCPENIPWWLDAAPESGFFERLAELSGGADTYTVRAYRIRFSGVLSLPGSYGHLGLYPRQITVHRLHDAEPAPDCLPRGHE